MPLTIDGGARTRATADQRRRHGGPSLLATFAGTPFEIEAARLAVDSAADMGSPLFVIDVVRTRRRRSAPARARTFTAAGAAALDAIDLRARDLGVEVEHLALATPRPLDALLDAVGDRRPALVVFGADPRALRRFGRRSRRRYRSLLRGLETRLECLLWSPTDAATTPAPPPKRRARRRR